MVGRPNSARGRDVAGALPARPWVERCARAIGRPRALWVIGCGESTWVLVNLGLGSRAFDPPPLRILVRVAGLAACLLLLLAWMNARRLARHAGRSRVRGAALTTVR